MTRGLHEDVSGSRRSPSVGLGLAGSLGAAVAATSRTPSAAAGGKDCGDLSIAVNPGWATWPTPTSSATWPRPSWAATSPTRTSKEEVGWQGMASGPGRHGRGELGAPGPDQEVRRRAEGRSRTPGRPAATGVIGWYVPPWMTEKYPDITDYKNLNKYADMFKTSESGGKGQLLDGDPVLRHQRRGAGEEPRPELQGGRRRQRGSPAPRRSATRRRTRSRCWRTSTRPSGTPTWPVRSPPRASRTRSSWPT